MTWRVFIKGQQRPHTHHGVGISHQDYARSALLPPRKVRASYCTAVPGDSQCQPQSVFSSEYKLRTYTGILALNFKRNSVLTAISIKKCGRFEYTRFAYVWAYRLVSRQLVYGHFVYDTSSTDISSTMTFLAEIEAGALKRILYQ